MLIFVKKFTKMFFLVMECCNGKLPWPLDSKGLALCEILLLKPCLFEKIICKVKVKHLSINSLILNGDLEK